MPSVICRHLNNYLEAKQLIRWHAKNNQCSIHISFYGWLLWPVVDACFVSEYLSTSTGRFTAGFHDLFGGE